MDGPRGYHAKWSKSLRERQMPYNFTHMWNLKKINQQQTRNILIDTENRLMIAREERVWGAGKKGEGIEKYRLVVLE